MFTGLVTAVGTIRQNSARPDGLELTVDCPYPDLQPGESIAVDGACLTVQAAVPGGFTAHVVRTSLERTRIQEYVPGYRVNLERALRVGDRLGGHLVQGHVDGLGSVRRIEERSQARLLDLQVPPELARLSVPVGSITVDGVSLTVNARPELNVVQISVVPFTLQHTTLGERRVGDRVHLEADILGKYVRAFMEEQRER
jgi:riboflavin synthase